MAIAQATRTTYDNVLRQVYTPKLWLLQNRDRILFQLISRDSRIFAEGKQINVRLHTAGSGGVGWSDAGTLPTAGVQQFDEAVANFKRIYGRFQIDGKLIASTRTDYAAEMRALEFEARNLVEDLADVLAYDIWQDGSGKLGQTIGEHSGAPVAGNFSLPKARCGIKKNQIIDLSNAAGGAGTDGSTQTLVTSITEHASDSTKFDVITDDSTGDGTWDDETYFAYRQSSRGEAVDGLSSMISNTGTYLGITRSASTEYWKSQVLANGGTNRGITLTLMQKMVDLIEQNSPGRCNLIITTHAIWRKIAEILVPDKRYGGEQMKLNGWCDAVDFRGVPVVRDKYATPNQIQFLDTDTLKFYQDSEGGFIDEDGLILRLKSGTDKFEAAWRRFLQFVCCDPASNGVLKDITE